MKWKGFKMHFSRRIVAGVILTWGMALQAQTDPGTRAMSLTTGDPLPGITTSELERFVEGKSTFSEIDGVANGLGPRFNMDSCAGCHAYPVTGGASPAVNPQIAVAVKNGANNHLPPFIQPDGPVRVVRFRLGPNGVPDGGVHDLFVISGRGDAPDACRIPQPDFGPQGNPQNNISFRIPTPVFGLGLIEAITDAALRANLAANADQKVALGIHGRFNTSGNDGTITRYGWKAQNKSLLLFSGEAYNVEMGVTSELFPQEREDTPACTSNTLPEDGGQSVEGRLSDIENQTLFIRYLAPPVPSASNSAIESGRNAFNQAGCNMCHTRVLRTGNSTSVALRGQDVTLYSDLALHQMGPGLADGVNQGVAQGGDWRTAPLWGLGDRIFLLHDGRTKDLMQAIQLHDSPGSEAHGSIGIFEAMTVEQKQDLLTFLRSL
jgi:CxxC motif-containing protein (DUF1111 family)